MSTHVVIKNPNREIQLFTSQDMPLGYEMLAVGSGCYYYSISTDDAGEELRFIAELNALRESNQFNIPSEVFMTNGREKVRLYDAHVQVTEYHGRAFLEVTSSHIVTWIDEDIK